MSTELFNGVEYFFNALKEKCSDDKEYAAEILRARGFLLEDDGFVLSDNSHQDDAKYLNELLTADNLGAVNGNKIFIRPNANVEKIFYLNMTTGGWAYSYFEDWKKFFHQKFAPKVPLRHLEPFVGRYIKAISACGVATCSSCDGNHPGRQKIFIEFAGRPDEVWHEIIRKRLLVNRFNLN